MIDADIYLAKKILAYHQHILVKKSKLRKKLQK